MIAKRYSLFFISLFILLNAIKHPVDLDLGWHLRYGQYFFQTGHVLKDNILSNLWPAYQWVQASWGYDLLVYQIFTHFGFFGVALFGGLFTLAIFLLTIFPFTRFSFFQLLFLCVIFLTQTIPLYFAGMRSQTPSTLFFVLAILIVQGVFLQIDTFPKKTYLFLPLLFFLWANMHGGFSLGLMLLTLIWITNGILLKWTKFSLKEWFNFGVILALSYITPLFNPWGFRIYEETFKHSTNQNLAGIVEWTPLSYIGQAQFISAIVVTIAVFAVALARKEVKNIPFLIAFLATTYLAFSANRFVILFGVLATYFLANNLFAIKWKLPSPLIPNLAKTALLILISIDLIFTHFFFEPFEPATLTFSWKNFCSFGDCSEKVGEAIRKDPPKGIGFHPYNFGGYLTWNVPEVKTFTDGRMAAWEENGKTPPVLESDRLALEPVPITYRTFDSIYHFNWVITYAKTPLSRYLDDLVKSNKWEKRYEGEGYSYYVKK